MDRQLRRLLARLDLVIGQVLEILAEETGCVARTTAAPHQLIIEALGGVFFPANRHDSYYTREEHSFPAMAL